MVLLKMKGASFLIFLIILMPLFLIAEENELKIEQSISIASAYYFPDNKGYELSGDFAPVTYSPEISTKDNERDLGSTWGGAELQGTYKYSLTKNMLTGGSSLTKDNNLKTSLKAGITPVNFEVGAETTLTPIAFLDFTLGSTISSGWKAIGVTGLGMNNNPLEEEVSDPFQGILSQSWLTGTFKFDTAAIMTGDTTWKHIILLSSHKLLYRYFSAAAEDESWVYQGTEANFNGFKYNQTSFIGYQMPLLLNMAGFIIETDGYAFNKNTSRSKLSDGGWGSDFLKVRFGGLFNLVFNDQHSLAILPQFTTRIKYTDETVKNKYFALREANTSSSTYIDFERIAFNYTYKF